MMDPEVKKRWLDALRNGEYQQGRHSLKRAFPYFGDPELADENRAYSYCCLGVLCEIEAPDEFRAEGTSHYYLEQDDEKWFGNQKHTSHLNKKLLTRFGIDRGSMYSLASMNDGGESFEKIALWIEENL